MRYVLTGIFLGLLAGFAPLQSYTPADSLYPEWHGAADALTAIKPSPFLADTDARFGYLDRAGLTILSADGSVEQTVPTPGEIRVQPSGDYSFYARYGKVDQTVSLHTLSGERFWVKEARQYPLLSHSARLVFLVISDLSGIFICNKDGFPVGDEYIGGKMAVAISFSSALDYAIAGFLSGNYHVIDDKGTVVYENAVPDGDIVKTAALSPHGTYAGVHHGRIDADMISVVHLENGTVSTVQLEAVHKTRTGLAVTDTGNVHVIDGLYYTVYDSDTTIIYQHEIMPQIHGHARVSVDDACAVLTYRTGDTSSAAYVFDAEGRLLLERFHETEKALDNELSAGVILLKGTSRLEAWSLSQAH
ncbi:MAG: hypothetical protein ACOCWH_03415 [Spirochaetota bacterium]